MKIYKNKSFQQNTRIWWYFKCITVYGKLIGINAKIIQRMKITVIQINNMKEKSHDHVSWCRKSSDKIQHYFIINSTQKTRNTGKLSAD